MHPECDEIARDICPKSIDQMDMVRRRDNEKKKTNAGRRSCTPLPVSVSTSGLISTCEQSLARNSAYRLLICSCASTNDGVPWCKNRRIQKKTPARQLKWSHLGEAEQLGQTMRVLGQKTLHNIDWLLSPRANYPTGATKRKRRSDVR